MEKMYTHGNLLCFVKENNVKTDDQCITFL